MLYKHLYLQNADRRHTVAAPAGAATAAAFCSEAAARPHSRGFGRLSPSQPLRAPPSPSHTPASHTPSPWARLCSALRPGAARPVLRAPPRPPRSAPAGFASSALLPGFRAPPGGCRLLRAPPRLPRSAPRPAPPRRRSGRRRPPSPSPGPDLRGRARTLSSPPSAHRPELVLEMACSGAVWSSEPRPRVAAPLGPGADPTSLRPPIAPSMDDGGGLALAVGSDGGQVSVRCAPDGGQGPAQRRAGKQRASPPRAGAPPRRGFLPVEAPPPLATARLIPMTAGANCLDVARWFRKTLLERVLFCSTGFSSLVLHIRLFCRCATVTCCG
jgi:hypothetical protein